jgi:DNA-directed RNA polymerase subunit RPC12/RpoP
VHRTFFERFSYLAIYECRDCENEEFVPRAYTYHMGEHARCPKCGTHRVTKLRAPDKIDPMMTGPLNIAERMAGGMLYHCCFCRVQFFDRRKRAPLTTVEQLAEQNGDHQLEVSEPVQTRESPDTASSDE